MESVPQYLTLAESSAYLAARGILTPEGNPYNPGTIKTWCGRGDFPNAKTIMVRCGKTSRPAWHIPICDLDNFTLRRDRPKPGYTTREAAALFGLAMETIEMYAREGKIPGAIKQGKDWYVTDEGMEAYRNRERMRSEAKLTAKAERIDPGPEKTCKKCGQVRPIGEYFKDSRYADGYQPWCQKCYASYRNRPDQKAKQKARYKKQYSNPEQRRHILNKQNAAFRERWHNDPAFRRRKIIQKNFINHRRRCQTKEGDLTVEQWIVICNHYDNKCLCCGKREVTLDHIKPLSRGGEHTASNVQPLCKSCNSSKMTKTIDYRPDNGRGVV